jgi:hypothetical protein
MRTGAPARGIGSEPISLHMLTAVLVLAPAAARIGGE